MHATDPTLCTVLSRIREGICDTHVSEILQTRSQNQDINSIDLVDRTVIICSTRAERDKLNDKCLDKILGQICEYEADDCDNHGNGLRAADHQQIQHHREWLLDKLQLKLGARIILRRNMDIDAGWVNGTLAVVTGYSKNVQSISVPRFRQRIETNGTSYTILGHQFPLQLAYAVTAQDSGTHYTEGDYLSKFILCLWASISGF